MGTVVERNLSLRPKMAADEAFIARLSAQAFSDFDRHAGPRTLSLTQRDGVATRVATRDGLPLGFVTVEFERDGAWVQAIAVAPNERGRGVGALLMAEAVRLARRAGARQLRLTTADANVEALELFLKCGFVIERHAERYYARGQDACILRRTL